MRLRTINVKVKIAETFFGNTIYPVKISTSVQHQVVATSTRNALIRRDSFDAKKREMFAVRATFWTRRPDFV